MLMIIEDIIERANRRFAHIGGDFVLLEDSPVHCPFLRITSWEEAWTALYVRKLKFGQFTEEREVVDSRKYVPFGASEIIMEALKENLLDAAVLACDGAGTVITGKPEIVQGIGGRMSGLIYTIPRKGVIERLHRHEAIILDPETARIDPVEGTKRALEKYKRVAVTVTASDKIQELRKFPEVSIFVVHTTGITPEQADYTVEADIVWGCASRYIRKVAGPVSRVQLGVGIPVFVLTEQGIRLVIPQIKDISPQIGDALEKKLGDIQKGETYLIRHKRDRTGITLVMERCPLPVLRESGPRPLV